MEICFQKRKGIEVEARVILEFSQSLDADDWVAGSASGLELVSKTDGPDAETETLCYRTTDTLDVLRQLFVRLRVVVAD